MVHAERGFGVPKFWDANRRPTSTAASMHANGVDRSDIIPHRATRLLVPKKGNGPSVDSTMEDWEWVHFSPTHLEPHPMVLFLSGGNLGMPGTAVSCLMTSSINWSGSSFSGGGRRSPTTIVFWSNA